MQLIKSLLVLTAGIGLFPASLPVPLKVISYPDKVKGREEIYEAIQDFIG